jgi:protein-S-isoprenylcysteine O-methyltransferase Ste14
MSVLVKTIVFVAVSMVLMYLSRRSLQNVKSHGFFRFFAWAAILALVVHHLDIWFREPLRLGQLMSWLFLILSALLAGHTFELLCRVGRPDKNRIDPSLVGIEKTTVLITVGAYKYIRHPAYSSLLLLAWGVFFKSISPLSVPCLVLATAFLIATAKVEEKENLRYFGDAYRDYTKTTKMFIPYLF